MILLGYIWSSPLTLVSMLLAALYRPRSLRWRDGVIEAVASRGLLFGAGGQAIGWCVWYATEEDRDDERLQRHERHHVRQAMIGGVLFAVAYGACFLWLWAWGGFRDWRRAYWRNPFEVAARARE